MAGDPLRPHAPSARPAAPSDLAAIAELQQLATAAVRGQRGGPQLLEDLAGGEDRDVVAGEVAAEEYVIGQLGDVPVGFCRLRSEPPRPQLVLFVRPEARGVGVGHALLDAAFERLRRLGAGAVDAVALPGDRATKNFFEAHGMVARAIVVGTRMADDLGADGDGDG